MSTDSNSDPSIWPQDAAKAARALVRSHESVLTGFQAHVTLLHNSLEGLNLDAVEYGLDLYDSLVELNDALDDAVNHLSEFNRAQERTQRS